MRQFTAPSPHKAGATDYFSVGTMTEFAASAATENVFTRGDIVGGQWHGNMSPAQAAHAAHNGDNASAAMSDKFLHEIEDLISMPSARHVVIDDVIGATPNVPAYLAGQPMNMRRKVKREIETAPIALVLDGTTSAEIKARDMHRRGAAMLALARALSAVRPVELYAMTGLDARNGNACYCLWQIETAPLDLARAAFMIAHPAATRGVMYRWAEKHYDYRGSWPYDKGPLTAAQMAKTVKMALPHIDDVICAPAIFATDALINDPVNWLRGAILAHGSSAGNDGE